jgi:hypothetical protein
MPSQVSGLLVYIDEAYVRTLGTTYLVKGRVTYRRTAKSDGSFTFEIFGFCSMTNLTDSEEKVRKLLSSSKKWHYW